MSKLPPGSTPLEHATVDAINSLGRLGTGLQLIRTGKREIPDDIVSWLIWEYGLSELLPYLPDPRVAIREGVKWQRLRGTPAALRAALGWIGVNAARLEETEPGVHFADNELDLGFVPNTPKTVRGVLGVAKLSLPARSALVRVFHGYDVRRFVLDESDWGDLFDAESGVDLDGVIQSFGIKIPVYTERQPTVQPNAGITLLRSVFTRYEDRALWDYWNFETDPWAVLNYKSGVSAVFGIFSEPLSKISGTSLKSGSWDKIGGTWRDPRSRTWRENQISKYRPIVVSKASIQFDDDGWKFGDANFCFPGAREVEVGQCLLFEQDLLDEHVWGTELLPVDEWLEVRYPIVNDTGLNLRSQSRCNVRNW